MSRFKVIQGDCIDIIPQVGFGYDFVFADPPFNIGHGYTGFVDRWPTVADYEAWVARWVSVVWDHAQGIVCLHGPDALADCYLIQARRLGMRRVTWLNWHYRFGQCGRTNWIDARCHCLVFSKVKEYTWNPEAVLVASDRVAYGDKRVAATDNGGRRLPGTVWGVPSDGPYWGRVSGASSNKERRPGHPNQLPELYLERLLRAYTNPGDMVLDPFCGSGTTATVAVALGRPTITIDISSENVASARQRILAGPIRVQP